MSHPKTIYISGFDIFHKDAYFISHHQKQICKEYGFLSLHPFDKELENNETPNDEFVKNIVIKNLKDISNCDIVIANLNSFRGAEPDSGTIFECGYAHAKGKIIIGYKNRLKSYVEEYIDELNIEPYEEDNLRYDKNNYLIDTFSKNFNIMVENTVIVIEGNFEKAVKKAKQIMENL